MSAAARTTMALGALAAAVAGVFPVAAHAGFPGQNGPLVVALNECSGVSRYLARVPWRGGPLTPITPKCEVTNEDFGARDVFSPDGSPDGRTIIARQERVAGGVGFVTLSPDGSDFRTVPAMPKGNSPSFAPDGQRFAYDDYYLAAGTAGDSAPEGIWEGNLDGSEPRLIRDNMGCDDDSSCGFLNPRWSPDGSLIAARFLTPYAPDRPGPIEEGIWLIRAEDGTLVRRLAKQPHHDYDWAPNGRSLVYSTGRHGRARFSGGNLYVVSRDGRRRRSLVHRHRVLETEPAWSPDGRWIAWVALRRGSDYAPKPSLWRVRAAGGTPERVRALPVPSEEEGYYSVPDLSWLPRAR